MPIQKLPGESIEEAYVRTQPQQFTNKPTVVSVRFGETVAQSNARSSGATEHEVARLSPSYSGSDKGVLPGADRPVILTTPSGMQTTASPAFAAKLAQGQAQEKKDSAALAQNQSYVAQKITEQQYAAKYPVAYEHERRGLGYAATDIKISATEEEAKQAKAEAQQSFKYPQPQQRIEYVEKNPQYYAKGETDVQRPIGLDLRLNNNFQNNQSVANVTADSKNITAGFKIFSPLDSYTINTGNARLNSFLNKKRLDFSGITNWENKASEKLSGYYKTMSERQSGVNIIGKAGWSIAKVPVGLASSGLFALGNSEYLLPAIKRTITQPKATFSELGAYESSRFSESPTTYILDTAAMFAVPYAVGKYNPVKFEKLTPSDIGSKPIWTGVYAQIGKGEGGRGIYPIAGLSEGKVIVGSKLSENALKILDKKLSGYEGLKVDSPIETKFIKENIISKYSKEERLILDKTFDVRRTTYGEKSKFIAEELPISEVGKLHELKPETIKNIKNWFEEQSFAVKNTGFELGGSTAQKGQTFGKPFRTPHDYDFYIKNPLEKSKEILNIVEKTEGKGKAFYKKEGEPAIETSKGTLFDIHDLKNNLESDLSSAFTSSENKYIAFGFKGEKPIKVGKLYATPLSEQATRKIQGAYRLRTNEIKPAEHRFKDIPDYLSAETTLTESRGFIKSIFNTKKSTKTDLIEIEKFWTNKVLSEKPSIQAEYFKKLKENMPESFERLKKENPNIFKTLNMKNILKNEAKITNEPTFIGYSAKYKPTSTFINLKDISKISYSTAYQKSVSENNYILNKSLLNYGAHPLNKNISSYSATSSNKPISALSTIKSNDPSSLKQPFSVISNYAPTTYKSITHISRTTSEITPTSERTPISFKSENYPVSEKTPISPPSSRKYPTKINEPPPYMPKYRKSKEGKGITRYSLNKTFKKKRYKVAFFNQYTKSWVDMLKKESPFESAAQAQRYGGIVSLKKKKFTSFMISEAQEGNNFLKRPDKVPLWSTISKRFKERETLSNQPELQRGRIFRENPPKGRGNKFFR